MASASVAQAHRASLKDGTPVVVKSCPQRGRRRRYWTTSSSCGSGRICRGPRRGSTAYSPTVVVDEFDTMMRAAIDLGQELANLQLFTRRRTVHHQRCRVRRRGRGLRHGSTSGCSRSTPPPAACFVSQAGLLARRSHRLPNPPPPCRLNRSVDVGWVSTSAEGSAAFHTVLMASAARRS